MGLSSLILGELLEEPIGRMLGMPNDIEPWYGDILDVVTPDWLHRYSWQEPAALQGPMAQAAGIDPSSIGVGSFGQWGTTGAKRDRFVTTIQRVTPTGQVITEDVYKGKPLLSRQDLATVRKVKKTTAKLKRWFPTKSRKKRKR